MADRSAAMLEVWEDARSCAPPERALRLLAWARPQDTRDDLAALDLGARDWHLLRIREALFGPRMEAHGSCPHCGEPVEVELDARALHQHREPGPPPCHVSPDGRRFRLPTSLDLLLAGNAADIDAAADQLLRACCLDGEVAGADVAEVERGLRQLAMARRFDLDLNCEACGKSWTCAFDPGAFLWAEIDARARALLDDVHCLASCYGWREADILAMSDLRRMAYLERVS